MIPLTALKISQLLFFVPESESRVVVESNDGRESVKELTSVGTYITSAYTLLLAWVMKNSYMKNM